MTARAGSERRALPKELRPFVPDGDDIVLEIRSSLWAVLLESLPTLLVLLLLAVLLDYTIGLAVPPPFDPDAIWLFAASLAALRLLWQLVVVLCRRYVLTDTRVLRVAGVFSRAAASLPRDRLQHVLLHRTLLERLTGTGSIGFATAGTGVVEVVWLTIDRPVSRATELRRVTGARDSGPSRAAPDARADRPMPPRPVLIGLAGGIGSGKSTVAQAFAELGCLVSDSDRASREALQRPDVRDRLVSWWGDRALGKDGQIDRAAVAAIVFSEESERKRLESLIHPIVRESREALLDRAARAGAPAVIVDAPLLFEAGLDRECDAVVFVHTPRNVRLERVRETRGWDEEEMNRREKVQLPLDDKRKRSDHEIVNDADPGRLVAAARRTLDQILATRRNGGPAIVGPRVD